MYVTLSSSIKANPLDGATPWDKTVASTGNEPIFTTFETHEAGLILDIVINLAVFEFCQVENIVGSIIRYDFARIREGARHEHTI